MPPGHAFLTDIAVAVPGHDIHQAFIGWARQRLDGRTVKLFDRMVGRSGIAHRWSVLPPTEAGESPVASGGFYEESPLPPTSARMMLYGDTAPDLALKAVAGLGQALNPATITHLVVTSCTGFVAPGIDQIVAKRLGLNPGVERLLIGFMGCYAAISALRSARHIVRSDPQARVLVITVELSTLHLIETHDVESLLAMLQFGDGAAAALVSSDPRGAALGPGFAVAIPGTEALIRWDIGDRGFAMHLSGEVPARLSALLSDPAIRAEMTGQADLSTVAHWAVHAGGRSILDAVEHALDLDQMALSPSRSVLADYGNMSSSTLMFVLWRILSQPRPGHGIALAFGPGLAAEGLRFEIGDA